MNIDNFNVSYQPSSGVQINQFQEENHKNQKKFILQIVFIGAFILLLLFSIITLILLFRNKKSLCVINFNSSTSTTIQPYTSTFKPLSTTDGINSNNIFVLNPCIERNIEYRKWGMPILNYSLYSIDVSLLIPTALISLNVTIYPSNIDCTWSLDVFPMDGRYIPFSGRPTNSVFGLYDQAQNLTVEESNISNIDYWSNGTGKFTIGITGAWYGDAPVGCQANGIINICFYHSLNI